MDPNVSQRRLSITCQNVGSFNSLFALGNIRKDQGKDRKINFTTEQEGGPKHAKMGDFASSTITDLRQIMMQNEIENLVAG